MFKGPDSWYILIVNAYYYLGYTYVANLNQPGCNKFINGDPITSILDPFADKHPILFDICIKRRDGAQEWKFFPHDGNNRTLGMNSLYGDLHAEWKNIEAMRAEYHYDAPSDQWW